MGRRPAFFIYLFIESVFAIATAFAPTFGTWLACRIGVGFTVPAIMGTPFVMGKSLVSRGEQITTYHCLIIELLFKKNTTDRTIVQCCLMICFFVLFAEQLLN